jgi:hypothetical protein
MKQVDDWNKVPSVSVTTRRSTSSLDPNEMIVSVSLEGPVESLGDDLVAVIQAAWRCLSDIAMYVSLGTDSRSRLIPC